MARTSFKPTRERKQRRLNKTKSHSPGHSTESGSTNQPDPNAAILIPPAPGEDRRAQLKAELVAGAPKMSSKKAKRLNKYIEKKLRKEETNALLAKLAETKVDTSLLRSAKELGRARETKKERVGRALREEQAGILSKEEEGLLYVQREVRHLDQWEAPENIEVEEEEEKAKGGKPKKVKRRKDDEDKEEQADEDKPEAPIEQMDLNITTTPTLPSPQFDSTSHERSLFHTIVGAGLKRPLELDEFGKPILKRIRRSRNLELRAPPPMSKLSGYNWDRAEGTKGEEEERSGSENEDTDDMMNEESDEEANGEGKEEWEEWNGFSDDTESEIEETDGGEDCEEEEVSEDGEADDGDDDDDDGDGDGGDDDNDDDDGGDEEGDEVEEESPVPRTKKGTSSKASAFKDWALSQRLKVLNAEDHTTSDPTTVTTTPFTPTIPAGYVPKPRIEDSPPPPELATSTSTSYTTPHKAFYVSVERPLEIQSARLALPVVAMEQPIMEAITMHPCVVICGETGSGKTTQVPQFLYEAGYGNPDSPTPGLIGVTQPRRVAAVSMAHRVGVEVGEPGRERVAYQIRFEATVGPKTAIKFMTDGVLLRELAQDFLLNKYSAIIIDEAHERGINTDILIGVMSRVIKLREELHKEDPTMTYPLKLIIMSATLRVTDFTENKLLFSTSPPVITAEARQYPVTIHFSRRTARDYVDEAYKKICKIHRRLPTGGILVFLTGQNEIQHLMKKLRRAFPVVKGTDAQGGGGATRYEDGEQTGTTIAPVKILASEAAVEAEDIELCTTINTSFHNPSLDDTGDYDNANDELDLLSDAGTESDLGDFEMELPDLSSKGDPPLHILPLYSLLPTAHQLRIFDPPPPGHRLCVLATNIAETSLTIPNIRYVVDTGRAKSRTYNKDTGVTSYDIGWVSKASAAQRSGRAGRTGPGHCYRLYSSAVYERDFEKFASPEILRMPIEGVVLQMKSMNIEKVVNFPFPTPPDRGDLKKAERVLGYLGALKTNGPASRASNGAGAVGSMLTDLGRTMSVFPLPPRFAKILIIGQQHGCLPYVIALVAALSVGELFIPENQLGFVPTASELESKSEVPESSSMAPTNAENLAQVRAQALLKAYHASLSRFSALDPTCDVLRLLAAVCAFEHEYSTPPPAGFGTPRDREFRAEKFCADHFLRYKALIETRKLRKQLTEIVKTYCPGAAAALNPPPPKQSSSNPNSKTKPLKPTLEEQQNPLLLPPPTPLQIKALKQIVSAGFIDQIALRYDLHPTPPAVLAQPHLKKPSKMTQVPYLPLFLPPITSPTSPTHATIYPSSVLARIPVSAAPPYIIYSTLSKSSNSSTHDGMMERIRMHPLTPLTSSKHVAALAKGTRLLTWSKPLGHIPEKVVGEGRKEVWVVPRLRGEEAAGEGVGWELGVEKVVMVKREGGWVVE